MPQPSRLSSLITELKRRRVFRVAAVYGGVAFVLVQIIDGTFEVMGIPAWVSRLAIILLTLGFPLAVGLAWVFDITPEGIVRTDRVSTDSVLKAKVLPSGGKPLTSNRAMAVIAILAVAFGVWSRWGRLTPLPGRDRSAIRAIAVLPLDNHMGGPDQDYFVDGMTESLINQLSRLGGLKIISRTSAMRYKHSDKSIPEMAAELGVDAVVEGSVFRAGDMVRITAQLIEGRTDAHLWSGDYEGRLEDILSLHRDVARAIAQEINLTLSPEVESYLAAERAVNPEAFDLYIRGRHEWNKRTGRHVLEALRLFKAALDIDPSYALAHSALAETYPLLSEYAGQERERVNALGRAAARRAIQLDPTLAQPYAALGLMAKEVDSAAVYFDRAIALNPNYATTYHWYALSYYSAIGDSANALRTMRMAADVDPLSNVIQLNLVYFNDWFAERYPSMLEKANQLLVLSPDFKGAKHAKGFALLLLDRPNEAETWLEEGANTESDRRLFQGLLAAARGDWAKAESIANALRPEREQLNNSGGGPHLASIWIATGNSDSALVELDYWAAGRDPASFGELYLFPYLKDLRLDSRFEEILDRHRREWARTHGGL